MWKSIFIHTCQQLKTLWITYQQFIHKIILWKDVENSLKCPILRMWKTFLKWNVENSYKFILKNVENLAIMFLRLGIDI